MEFKSKTALAEHLKHLVKDGYLTEDWLTQEIDGKTTARKFYTVNFNAVKVDES